MIGKEWYKEGENCFLTFVQVQVFILQELATVKYTTEQELRNKLRETEPS